MLKNILRSSSFLFIIFSIIVFSNSEFIFSEKKVTIEDAHNALKFNNFDKAVELYSNLIDNYSKYAPFFYGRGMAYYYLNKNQEAESDFQKAINLDNNYFDAQLGLALVLIGEGKNKKSYDFLNKAIQINPNSSDAFYSRGLLNYVEQNFTNSVEDFSEAIKLNENNLNAIYGRAISYYQLEDFNNAKVDFEHFVSKNDSSQELKNETNRLLKLIEKFNNLIN